MAGGGGGGEGEPEFQVAPMVDVLLTILIFFMTITSAQVLRVDKSIKLPIAPSAQKKDNTRAEAIINVRWDPASKKSQVVYEDRLYARVGELTPTLKGFHDRDPKYRAVIRGDREVPAADIALVMNACGDAGISDISFSAVNKE